MGRMVVDGGSKMQRRAGRRMDISEEQIETFLVTLGDTCNVVRSAKAAGFSANWAYRKRKREAAFRAAWAEAVREGYAKLELVLLERAIKGTPKPFIGRDGSTRVMREYSTPLAIALLKRHAEAAEAANYQHDPDEMREVRDRILEKLERMRAQDAGNGDGVETKGVLDRVGLIVWGVTKAGKQALPSADIPSTQERRRSLEVGFAPLTSGQSPSPASGRGKE